MGFVLVSPSFTLSQPRPLFLIHESNFKTLFIKEREKEQLKATNNTISIYSFDNFKLNHVLVNKVYIDDSYE